MSKEKWIEAVGNVDADIVEEFVEKDRKLLSSKKKSSAGRTWIPRAAICACLAALLLLSVLVLVRDQGDKPPILSSEEPSTATEPTETSTPTQNTEAQPEKELIVLQAQDLEQLFPVYDSATNRYQEVYTPSLDMLNLEPVQQQDTLPVYQKPEEETEERLRAFIEKYKDPALTLFGLPDGELKVVIDTWGDGSPRLEAEIRTANRKHALRFDTYQGEYQFYHLDLENDWELIGGAAVSVMEEDSDEEILQKLENVIQVYSEYFNMEFTDFQIQRNYYLSGSYYDLLKDITVYLYQEAAPSYSVTAEAPLEYTEWIQLELYTDWGSGSAYDWGGSQDEAYLTLTRFCAAYSSGQVYGEARMLPLEEAEAMLEKGWVFGFHVCDLCMANQVAVDFSDYDAVYLEYVVPNGDGPVIPFYVFFKQLSEGKYGINYAKTYVPAVEVEGLEEYFTLQEQKHK